MWSTYYDKVPSDSEQELVEPLAQAEQLERADGVEPSSPTHHVLPAEAQQQLNWDEAKSARLLGALHAWRRRVEVIVCCVAYTLVGPSVIVANNHIMKRLHFPYPMTLSVIGLCTTALCCTFVLRVVPMLVRCSYRLRVLVHRKVYGVRAAPEPLACSSWCLFQPKSYSLRFWLCNMVPIGVAQGLTFACGNAAYMYLTITFTQMLSAFTPSVTLLLLYISGVEIPTCRATVAVLLIGCGCALSSYGEGRFHLVATRPALLQTGAAADAAAP